MLVGVADEDALVLGVSIDEDIVVVDDESGEIELLPSCVDA